ncbi:DUF4244 domain-containing protein [Brevibacterium sp. p3-SID960]|uniref:DUF4244 domain-containing protein n=1 Tax=Brevibacterium sp. p3-SID960 TaxID=2916063 RepID=UPI0021A2A3B6|nr:DUF4244 domain-containing protein [Brevibacterium sp. p3-SID960]MCT1689422.1 DUF4244 domain-containing protein [Brevibacterium sp. p3-SID960]
MDTTHDRTAPARSLDQQMTGGEQTRLLAQRISSDEGATTAEYAITTLAACGLAALLVTLLKSETLLELVTGVISSAFGLGS